MEIKPIRTNAEHEEALHEVERLWKAEESTPDGDRLDVLITLVEAYERSKFPIDLPNPVEAIKFRLEQQGADATALIGVIGSRTRVYEVLRGDRGLSLAMIRRLHDQFHIPAETLIRPIKKRKRVA